MKHLYALPFICLLLAGTCQQPQEKTQQQTTNSLADILSDAESYFFGIAASLDLKNFQSPDSIRRYFLDEGFTQVPVEEKHYQLAGLYDRRAGQVEITHSTFFKKVAYVKKVESGVGVIVVTLPEMVGGDTFPTNSQRYFFSKFELGVDGALTKCDAGNSVILESYQHCRNVNGNLLGRRKGVSMIELCFDGAHVSKGTAVVF